MVKNRKPVTYIIASYLCQASVSFGLLSLPEFWAGMEEADKSVVNNNVCIEIVGILGFND